MRFRVQYIDTASPIAVAVASGLRIRPLVVTHVYNLELKGRDRQLNLVVITRVIYSLSNLCLHKLSKYSEFKTDFSTMSKERLPFDLEKISIQLHESLSIRLRKIGRSMMSISDS